MSQSRLGILRSLARALDVRTAYVGRQSGTQQAADLCVSLLRSVGA